MRSHLLGFGNCAIAFIVEGMKGDRLCDVGEVRSPLLGLKRVRCLTTSLTPTHYLSSDGLESSAKISNTVIRRKFMGNQELEQQLLSLDLAERIRILQLLAQSLTLPSSQPNPTPDEINLTRDRSPQHPLRKIPLTIPPDFDEPMPELWDALGQ
ncbi:hypothetical protein [Nostoc sp. PCC 7107]|uniref:hypothetical protein n=1 Tax=Nostoc sp. PCC 7107 TaxID=317936 RepID=UPI0002D6B1A1|nr:hypothetical protein [Nostoc sp. PCC 7107]